MQPPQPDRTTAQTVAPFGALPAAASAETLAQARTRILAAFRTRRELIRWDDVTDYANAGFAGVHELRVAARDWGQAALIPITQKAIDNVVKVSLRADDSNGEIGDLVGDLLDLHAELCRAAPPKPAVLAAWLIDFRFDGTQDYFEPDIADYTDALGAPGLTLLAERLDQLEAARPAPTGGYDSNRWLINHYRERLAVASRDPEQVIASFGELTRSYRMLDLAKALTEVGAVDQALDYAERATLLETSVQAEHAGRFWCELVHQHRPHDEVTARQVVVDRWPNSRNALTLATAADDSSAVEWSSLAEAVYAKLETQPPRELITTLLGRGLVERAWEAAGRLTDDPVLWTALVAAREKTDPAVVVPVLIVLIQKDLEIAKPRNYKSAVARLRQLRRALKATNAGPRFALIMGELREENRRRRTLLRAFDRAGF